MIYLSHTYRIIVSYLKGIHQTLDSLRKGRTKDGWRLYHKEMLACSRNVGYETGLSKEDAPVGVKPVDRLKSDLFALQKLLEGPTPRQVLVMMISMA